jgi:putative AdoMet-dependent methyltransferase
VEKTVKLHALIHFNVLRPENHLDNIINDTQRKAADLMNEDNERRDLFDVWSADYDQSVNNSDDFPFAGYQETLSAMVRWAEIQSHYKVLDVGIGTGTLSHLLPIPGEQIWGMDFSQKMLEKASEALPDAHLMQVDLLSETWPLELQQPFDRIVSGYTFHEFNDQTKIALALKLAQHHLAPGGSILLADISFGDQAAFSQNRQHYQDFWDEDEYYWCADRMIPLLERSGFSVAYLQTSFCAGIYRLQTCKGGVI